MITYKLIRVRGILLCCGFIKNQRTKGNLEKSSSTSLHLFVFIIVIVWNFFRCFIHFSIFLLYIQIIFSCLIFIQSLRFHNLYILLNMIFLHGFFPTLGTQKLLVLMLNNDFSLFPSNLFNLSYIFLLFPGPSTVKYIPVYEVNRIIQ